MDVRDLPLEISIFHFGPLLPGLAVLIYSRMKEGLDEFVATLCYRNLLFGSILSQFKKLNRAEFSAIFWPWKMQIVEPTPPACLRCHQI